MVFKNKKSTLTAAFYFLRMKGRHQSPILNVIQEQSPEAWSPASTLILGPLLNCKQGCGPPGIVSVRADHVCRKFLPK